MTQPGHDSEQSDNARKLQDLQHGATSSQSAGGNQPSGTSPDNQGKLAGLNTPQSRPDPVAGSSPVRPSQPQFPNEPPPTRGQAAQRRWPWLVAAAGVVVVIAVGVAIAVGGGGEEAPSGEISAPLQTPTQAPPSEAVPVEAVPVEAVPGPNLYNQPVDIAALIDTVTASTVFIECDTGFGSGFVMDAEPLTGVSGDSVLVTNHHVAAECDDMSSITSSSQRGTFPVVVLGMDKRLDLAVLQADGQSLSPLEISLQPTVGQWAMAVGNPLGVEDSVSFGAVTAYKPGEALITHDAVIGPGNSGGPLVNASGQVIGINSAVWEDATGIGIAVPLDEFCRRLLDCQG